MHLSDPLSRLSSHNTQDGNKEEVQGLKVNICDITSLWINLRSIQPQMRTSNFLKCMLCMVGQVPNRTV